MSASPTSLQRQTALEHGVSAISRWTAVGRYRWEVGEELGQPGWGLLQQEMEEALARERSKGARAGSCHPWCAVVPGTDRLEEEEVKGRGLSGQGIYDQKH